MEKLVSFFEIPAADFHRAVKFYQSIMEVEFSIFDCGDEKMAFFPEESNVPGAISYDGNFKPSAEGVLIHFQVADVQKTLASVEKNGGKTVRSKTKIECEGRGYFGLFRDSEGNTLGLYSDK